MSKSTAVPDTANVVAFPPQFANIEDGLYTALDLLEAHFLAFDGLLTLLNQDPRPGQTLSQAQMAQLIGALRLLLEAGMDDLSAAVRGLKVARG